MLLQFKESETGELTEITGEEVELHVLLVIVKGFRLVPTLNT